MGRDGERGQASVELVAAIPALIAVTLVVAQLAIAGYALWGAGAAARAGARAAYVGGDAQQAALASLPPALRDGARVNAGDGVEVEVRTPAAIPGLPRMRVTAQAGFGVGESSAK